MNLIQMSISASIIVIAVIIVRALAINHLPKKTFLIMWAIVLLRLLIPISIPSSFSIYSLIGHDSVEQIMNTPIADFLSFVTMPQDNTNRFQSSSTGHLLWVSVWGIGTLLCILYFIVAYIRCRREFASSVPIENDFTTRWLSEHMLKRSMVIHEHAGISAPLTYGIIQPVILMPKQTDWEDIKKLQFILTHEYVHIRRFDGVTKIVLTAALCIHWFNPFMWVMYVLANRDLELSCDEIVVHSFGENMKSAYALALINMEERKNGLLPFYNNFSRNAIEERIKAIMMVKKATKFRVFISLVMVLGITIPFATSVQAVSPIADNSKLIEDKVGSLPSGETDSIKFAMQATAATFGLDSSNKIIIPISIQSLSPNTAYCIGEVPDIRNVSMLQYEVHASDGTGYLCVAMKKVNEESDWWFNFYKKDKDFQNMSWENADIDTFGYDENYSGTYSVFIINKNGSPDSTLSNVTGSITIVYKK